MCIRDSSYNEKGIHEIVKQQFAYGVQIAKAGFVPILEPEVDIHSQEKGRIESFLKAEMDRHLADLDDGIRNMFKMTLPDEAGLYDSIASDEMCIRDRSIAAGLRRRRRRWDWRCPHVYSRSASVSYTHLWCCIPYSPVW